MKQLILPFNFQDEELIRLAGKQFHYLTAVLRLKTGDTFLSRNQQGELFLLEIVKKEQDRLILKAHRQAERQEEQQVKSPRLNLYQGLPKGQKMDLIIRQATEAGASRIVPFISDYTVPHNLAKEDKEERVEKKLARWERIATEAVQQSGSLTLPVIDSPLPFREMLAHLAGGLSVFFHQDRLTDLTLHHYLHNGPDSVNLIVGPEGGFSEAEVNSLLAAEAKAVYLGKTVLRTETAALFALAAVKIILLELESWKLKS